jgi:hypothetical protein
MGRPCAAACCALAWIRSHGLDSELPLMPDLVIRGSASSVIGPRPTPKRDYRFGYPMKKRILVLGAGFGGLELSTMLSEAFGDGIEVMLIDKNDAFYLVSQSST